MTNDILKDGFDKVQARATRLRLTEVEVVAMVGDPPMPYTTYWRAKTGVTGPTARVKVLRRVEALLDQLEAERKRA